MHTILSCIVLVLSLLMFIVKREHKICLLFIYLLCFNEVRSPILGDTLTPCLCFFLSELLCYQQYYSLFKRTKFKYPLLILLLSIFLLAIKSPHVEGFVGVIKLFRNQFIMRYGIIFMIFVACLSIKNQKSIIKVSFICLLILTGFGILNLLTKHAIYIDWVLSSVGANSAYSDAGAMFAYSDRFRVQSMFANPFDYGYACLMLFLYYLYLHKGRLIGKKVFYVATLCCLFGIFTCGCRTLLACFIIGGLVFAIFGYNFKSKVKIALTALFLLFCVSLMIPDELNKQVSFLTSAFSDEQMEGSSSLSMRQLQTVTVLYYIKDNMAFGRGYGFFLYDLGWGEGREAAVDKDLQGLEGVYMNFLLERGVVGLVLYALYIFSLIIIISSLFKKTRDRKTLALNLSIIASYLAFANMTGELDSVPITLTLIGASSAYSYKDILRNKLQVE